MKLFSDSISKFFTSHFIEIDISSFFDSLNITDSELDKFNCEFSIKKIQFIYGNKFASLSMRDSLRRTIEEFCAIFQKYNDIEDKQIKLHKQKRINGGWLEFAKNVVKELDYKIDENESIIFDKALDEYKKNIEASLNKIEKNTQDFEDLLVILGTKITKICFDILLDSIRKKFLNNLIDFKNLEENKILPSIPRFDKNISEIDKACFLLFDKSYEEFERMF